MDLAARRRRHPHNSHESAAGRPEQLADVGRCDPGPRTTQTATRLSDARDSEPLLVSVAGARVAGYIALTNRCSFLPGAGRVTVRG